MTSIYNLGLRNRAREVAASINNFGTVGTYEEKAERG
jgi:hypothetical protein